MISLIVAKSLNDVIGRDNDLPWYLPDDLKNFKNVTLNSTVIMGKNTYQSILGRLGKALPKRRNIVISTSLSTIIDGFELATSFEEALKLCASDQNVFIIGGSQLYQSVLDSNALDQMYITEIQANIDGDTYFPKLDTSMWVESSRIKHGVDEKHQYAFDFVIYKRKTV